MRRLPKTKNWFLKMKRRARGPALGFLKLHPTCEFLEGRQLLASSILFNPTGTNQTQPILIGALDWAPGNNLAVSSVPLSVGKTFQLDYQAALAGVIDPNGNDFSPPGLNTTYQLTAVASVTEVVTSLTVNGTVATFTLAPMQSPTSFFEIYYNQGAPVADDLAGTGFNVGTLILTASPDPTLTNSSEFALAGPIQVPFDQFPPDNYPGILSVTGAGSAVINAPVSTFDPLFFETAVTQTSFNTSNITPFLQTDPSALFVGSPGGAPPNVTPNIGAINGVTGPDFQFQADGNSSFIAPPTITTTASNSITLGTTAPTISDSLVLSGGISPTGSVTFSLTGPGGFTYSQSDSVSSNGTYTASTTLPTTGTVAGTYTWSATYSGDANNSSASETGNATNGEQTVVTPTLPPPPATTASPNITLGTTAPTISDSLVLSGAFFPTGSVTFSLSGPNGFTYSQSDSVSSNGTYTASTTLPTTGTVAGTYTWSATYSGDANNSSASETGNSTNGEQTVVTKNLPPPIATTASPNITLGTTAPTISDSLVLSGAFFPTGSVTFSLSGPNGFTYSQSDSVSSNGTYTASTTLPTTGTVAGTYTWSATYSGDANNSSASETGNSTNGEQTVVTPTLPPPPATTASPNITLGTTAPTISDSLVLSGAFFPTGSVTFSLTGPSGFTYSQSDSVSSNGTYTASTTLPTTGTVVGTYTWSATYSGDANNSSASETGNSTNGEQTVVTPTLPPPIATTASPNITLGTTAPTISDSLVLSGAFFPTGSVTFSLSGPSGFTYSQSDSVSSNGTYTASTTLPTTGTVAGTYTWSATYSGDANNSSASETGNSTNGEQTVVTPTLPPPIATTASPNITLGTTAPTISDSLVLSGAFFPTGSVTFSLSGPNGFTYSQSDSVSSNGTYTASTTLPTTGTVAGTYTWSATYSGDANNSSASETGNSTNGEQTVVTKPPTTSIATIPTPTSAVVGTPTAILKDSATLSGGDFPTGMITFTLVAPGGATVDTETVTVNGNGTYTTPTGYTLPTTAAVTGTYQWNATYTGDGINNAASDINSTSEQVMVCPMVVNVQRFGIHQQPTQIVVTFNGTLEPAEAENINNYHVFTLGPEGKFTVPARIASAVYNPANDSVTLTLAHSYNVHHLAEIVVTNPCPGGPPFTGVLNRKFSLGAIDWHGHLIIPKKTNEPGVLNPAVLPKRITLATRPAELKLAKMPSSGAFPAGTTNTPGTVNFPFPPDKLTSATRRAELKLGRKTGPRVSTAVKNSEPTSGNRPKAGPLPSQSISAAQKLISHWTAVRDHGKHIQKSISRART